MLVISQNGENFIITTTMMTGGVIYTLSQFKDANRTRILTDSGILLTYANSEYDLLFVCFDDNVTFTIGMLTLL